MAGRVAGKVALITGGGSGIGRATAHVFAREGAKVVVADVVVAGGEETVRLLKLAGGEATFVKTDVSRATEVQTLVQQTVETYGRLDCASNNAGIEEQVVAMEPIGRMAAPAEVGEAVVWLCSDAASFVTGLPLAVDGGWVAQ